MTCRDTFFLFLGFKKKVKNVHMHPDNTVVWKKVLYNLQTPNFIESISLEKKVEGGVEGGRGKGVGREGRVRGWREREG